MLVTLCAVLAAGSPGYATHIYTLDKDFNKLQADDALAKYVNEIVTKLKTFKVPVHPRIRLFYQLLKRGMQDHAQKNSDSLYNPNVYQTRENYIKHEEQND